MDEARTTLDIADLARRADAAASLLRTLANRYRIMILCELTLGERSVTELAGRLGLSQSALSQHLSRLRQDQLVQTRRAAQHIYYRIGDSSVREIMVVLYHVYCRKVEAEAAQLGMMPPPMGMGGMAAPMMPTASPMMGGGMMGGMPQAAPMTPMPAAEAPVPEPKRKPRRKT